MALEKADISKLVAAGWQPPQRITVKARDGVTELHGLLFRPTNFDASKKYPIINHIYPGPQTGSVGSRQFAPSRADTQALADNGFDVVQRPAFNVAYVGFNQAIPPMDNPKIRQAIAYAVDRNSIVANQLQGLATPLYGFVPAGNKAWLDPNLPKKEYSLDQSRTTAPNAQTTWTRLGRNDRDSVQRDFDPAHRQPRHRFRVSGA